tara:strand:- start:367 stop:1791 length:1425 start_codon:yes stop_codon:yes gene_type:complete
LEVIFNLKFKDLIKNKLLNQDHYHFIGLGGIGMSGIALFLLKKGLTVSGSDIAKSDRLIEIKNNGGIVFNSQKPENIDLIKKKFNPKNITIVISSAINDDNKELNYCVNQQLKIKHRSEILSILMKSYKSIAVAGSHGKTSTSTLLTTLIDLCTKDTSSIVGGILPKYESNTIIKNSKYLVAEIDESDGTTSKYKPYLGIINNIDFDHCDYYSNIGELISSFNEFGSNSEILLSNDDCKITKENITSDYTWSIKKINNVNFAMISRRFDSKYTIADYYENGQAIKRLEIPIPGIHNLSNITAAISACRILNIDINFILKNIQFLQLPKKRFDFRGEILGRKIIDDYGHHPNEIKATLELARLFIKRNHNANRLVIIFQPHRYTRVNKFLDEFVKELSKADYIIITNIFSAGENKLNNINSQFIADKIYKINKNVKYINSNHEIAKQFLDLTNKGDFILNMGAGDCHNLWSLLHS